MKTIKNYKKHIILTTALLLTIGLAGCSQTGPQRPTGDIPVQPDQHQQNIGTNTTSETAYSAVKVSDFDMSLSKKDMNSEYDEAAATKITFSGETATVNGSGATVSNKKVTITEAGTYILSGNGEGQVLVELADDSQKVQIVLLNLTLSNSNGAAILVGSADKVIITVPEGTTSTLSDGKSYTETYGESEVDAAVFSKEDLSINGTGTLVVNGNFSHGIVSKDDLVIYQTTVNVNTAENGITGKDSLLIVEADVNVTAGEDGLKSNNDEDDDKGYLYISESDVNVTAGDKGIIGEKLVYITSGNISVNSTDDSIHSNSTIQIDGGNIIVSTSDDGIHADCLLTINSGDINVAKSNEGIEAEVITINDGNISVTSSDDGLNCNGTSSSATGSQFGRGGMMDTNSNAVLTVNGGTLTVNAQGDGLDSNGYLVINGGTIYVYGPTNSGNGSIDAGISSTINGGTLISLGSSGMNERFGSVSQGTIIVDISTQRAGSVFELVDSNGNTILKTTAVKNFSNVTVSSPDIKDGQTYTIKVDGTTVTTVTMNGLQYFSASGMGGGGNQGGGGNPGGGGPRGNRSTDI